jgi:hypothetical protein
MRIRTIPNGDNVVLAEDIARSFTRNYGTLMLRAKCDKIAGIEPVS